MKMFRCAIQIGLIVFGAFAICLTTAAPSQYRSEQTLILGHEAEQNQFPYQVSVTSYLENVVDKVCGGTLISDKWILTAASCITPNASKILIGLGSNLIDQPVVVLQVQNYTIHSEYKPKQKLLPINDIAVLRMNGSVDFTPYIEPVYLPGEDQIGLSFEGVKARNSGWGTAIQQIPGTGSEKDPKPSNLLNWHELTVISNNECLQQYPKDVSTQLVCTRVLSGGNVCGCDIGGPLVIMDPEGWKLIGVSSYTPGCDSAIPSVFSRVTSHLRWIAEITGIQLNTY